MEDEDHLDIQAAREALAEKGEPISWERLKKELRMEKTHLEALGGILNLGPDQEDIRRAFRYIAAEMDRMEAMLGLMGPPPVEAIGFYDTIASHLKEDIVVGLGNTTSPPPPSQNPLVINIDRLKDKGE